MTIVEAAERLGVSPRTIRRWIHAGRLKSRMVPGPYGVQHDLSEEAIGQMQTALAVVTRSESVDVHTLASAIVEALATRDQETAAAIERLASEVSQLREAIEQRDQVKRRRWPWSK